MPKEAVVIHDGEIIKTDLARLFKFGDDEIWIPESKILWMDKDINEILLPMWLVEQKGLEGYIKE